MFVSYIFYMYDVHGVTLVWVLRMRCQQNRFWCYLPKESSSPSGFNSANRSHAPRVFKCADSTLPLLHNVQFMNPKRPDLANLYHFCCYLIIYFFIVILMTPLTKSEMRSMFCSLTHVLWIYLFGQQTRICRGLQAKPFTGTESCCVDCPSFRGAQSWGTVGMGAGVCSQPGFTVDWSAPTGHPHSSSSLLPSVVRRSPFMHFHSKKLVPLVGQNSILIGSHCWFQSC